MKAKFKPISKAELKLYNKLNQKKYREKKGLFLIQGHKIIEETLYYQAQAVEKLLLPERIEELQRSIQQLEHSHIATLAHQQIQKLSSHINYDGPLAVLNKQALSYPTPKEEQVILYLDGIKDPGNLGTIIRLADWYGLRRIHLSPHCTDPFNPKTLSATMGSFLRVEPSPQTTLKGLISQHPDLPVYAATLQGENIHTKATQAPCVLLIGSESHGLSEESLQLAPIEKIKIPAFGKAESLNAAVSTGILLDNLLRKATKR